jgi:predicted glycosyltransferase
MTTYLFYSHDGFGLGHARRSSLIGRAVLDADPAAEVVLMTGVPARLDWLDAEPRFRVLRMPPLLKDSQGSYRGGALPFEEAVARRRSLFEATVEAHRPDVVVVDRHPYGTAGELRAGLQNAARKGAAVVLGLRDVLDDPGVVTAELEGEGWAGVPELFTSILVYGAPHLVDHVAEYGLPMQPHYCGWVVCAAPRSPLHPKLIAVAAGGGGDGAQVFALGRGLLRLRSDWRGVLAPGPYADLRAGAVADPEVSGRMQVLQRTTSCDRLFAEAAAVLCMAGYNSTLECLAAGRRPILVPRRSPRREQAIRAWRLAALGLADVVDEGAAAAEVNWLLDRDRSVTDAQLEAAGISLDGAERAAAHLVALAQSVTRR